MFNSKFLNYSYNGLEWGLKFLSHNPFQSSQEHSLNNLKVLTILGSYCNFYVKDFKNYHSSLATWVEYN